MGLLFGCVDLGQIGIHPELQTVYFDGDVHTVANCLYYAALAQRLILTEGDPLPDGTQRFGLQDVNNAGVAWLDVSPSSHKQSSVEFFYAPHAPDIHKDISAIIYQCKKDLN